MPRTKRIIPLYSAMHIMCRGNNKQNIFNTEEDKFRYYCLIRELQAENHISILHYCLMSNHLHLIVLLNLESKISKFMKQLNLSYFNYYKRTYGYFGHLWQGRFKSNIIDTDSYLLQCGKYVELNPVRAGVVTSPCEYGFSSYNHYARGYHDSIITDNPAYLALSDSQVEREKHYIEFLVDRSIIKNKQQFIGSRAFIDKLRECYGIRNEQRKRGRPKKTELVENRNVP